MEKYLNKRDLWNSGKRSLMMLREKLMEVMRDSSFVHIIVNSKYHYNGWILSLDESYVQMRDRKTDEIVILKISEISLIEEVKENG